METTQYQKTFDIRWADLDPNRHVRHTVYADYATDLRFGFLSEHGFTLERFEELMLGPVLLREDVRYLREVRMGERITINMLWVNGSADGTRWAFRHEVRRSDGELAVLIDLEGGWLDLRRRRLARAPEELTALLSALPHAAPRPEPAGSAGA